MRDNKDNKAVSSIDELVNEAQRLEAEYQKLIRQRDLKVDTINKSYENKIDKVLRRSEFINMQMIQAKAYANKVLSGGASNE